MTLRTLYRSTRFDQPLPLPRGWYVLGAALLAWTLLASVTTLVCLVVRGMLS